MKQENIIRYLNFLATVCYCAAVFLIVRDKILLGALCFAPCSAFMAFAGNRKKRMQDEEKEI